MNQSYNNLYDVEPKGISGWLLKKGIAKDTKSANRILIIMLIVFVVTTFLVLNTSIFTPSPSSSELEQLDAIPVE